MIEFGIDEITDVLQYTDNCNLLYGVYEWKDIAEYMIHKFERNADLVGVFGNRSIERTAPAGYTIAYKYGCHDFYFAVAYHEFHMTMGIVVKFSAKALDFYLEKTGLTVSSFLQKVSDREYDQRLSRIDLTADFIDEPIDISEIYQTLMDERVAVFRKQLNELNHRVEYRKVPMKYEGRIVGEEVETIYVGSNKSNSRLRIYNKRKEQIANNGNKLEKAVKCNSWVRFEGVFRNDYAHQLSDELFKIKTDVELLELIASTLCNKYFFMNVNKGVAEKPTLYTQRILDAISNGDYRLRAPRNRSYELSKNIAYIFNGSGVMSTLYKMKKIWGIEAVNWLLCYIQELIQNKYIGNADCKYWLTNNLKDYQMYYPDFSTFVGENLSTTIKKGGGCL
ncbi:MAG: replication initiation factor domain-containing protein [Pseudobutyrivibrio sp.]|uniref:replication initiation factor domain-containing protein n=1 Tax=Pseudobutyrivibrio sp. TaxID=2014367 RepID=UPI0025D84C90|nr:replication initiation factor domain-containing protein [Pseudobutyrivibrio sp.]MBQ8490263.1 replication initiation factor domain-containing protein [Pseudobutyrivibrio sp.]